MTLSEAIEEVKREEPNVFSRMDYRCALAIATILNAIMKGELK